MSQHKRHQPVITRASAASYQHLFYSARIRKTKAHKVPIHRQDSVIIMLMRCTLFVLPQQMGRGKWVIKNRIKQRPALPRETKLYRTIKL